MSANKINDEALDQIFLKARTHNGWQKKPVSDELLTEIYNLARWAPTSANGSPMRVLFVKTPEAKEKLISVMADGNKEKTQSAPVTAVIAYDTEFFEKFGKLFPAADAKSWFVGNQPLIDETAFRNSSLQGAYFMLAARALGLDCGPMSGFDKAKLDEVFSRERSGKLILFAILATVTIANCIRAHPALSLLKLAKSSSEYLLWI